MNRADRLPVAALSLLVVICIATVWSPPAGRMSWALEVVPGLLAIAVMIAVYRKFRMSDVVYVAAFVQMMILIYGGYYTYAKTPLGNWAKEYFELSRNHYDRVGHFILGFTPTLATRELLLRTSPLTRGKWLAFLTFCVAFAIGAFWELLEWWTTLVVAGDVGSAFLGTQGDEWDAQADMMWVGIGSLVVILLLPRAHDKSIAAAESAQNA